MAIPMTKEEYKPDLGDVSQRLMENPDFVSFLQSFILSAVEGQPRWYPEALETFGQMTKLLAIRAESQLTEEYFESKDY